MSKRTILLASLLLFSSIAHCQTSREALEDSLLGGPMMLPQYDISPWPAGDSLLMPEYPVAAARDDIEGEVVVQMFVNKEGLIKKLSIARERPRGFGFGEVLEPALYTWHFVPAIYHGRAVGVWIGAKFNFRIEPDSNMTDIQGVAGKKISAPQQNFERSGRLKVIVVRSSDTR